MENKLKSFEEYFSKFEKFDGGGEMDKWCIAEGKKIYEALKHPKSIEKLADLSLEHKRRYVKDLDENHAPLTIYFASRCAREYADYKAKNEPETFDMYFEGYKYFDNGGESDRQIVADAKKVYEKLKTSEAIKAFSEYRAENCEDMEKDLRGHHLNITYDAVCDCALEYAEYAEKYCKGTSENQLSQSNDAVLKAKMADMNNLKR